MFVINQHKGFQITFANGYTVSIQFGPNNYCQRKYERDWRAPEHAARWASTDAEVAVFRPDDSFVHLTEFDDVKGYVTPDEVAQIIATVASDPESLAVKRDTNDEDAA